ncbi:MAG: cellulase family glycosylhydrolase [Acidobacteriota bacterium]
MKRWLAVVLLLIPILLPGRAVAVEASPFGVNIHLPQGAELQRILDQAQAAGIGWVRIDFVWAYVETSQDHFDWRIYDAIAAEARKRGIEVFATLAYTPQWATSGPFFLGVPDNPADWADFCSRAAKRYKGQIRYWGLWNEPNLDHFWAGTEQQYLDVILKTGADAIHAANPDAQVAGPELAHLTSGDADWYDWLRDTLLQAGGRLDLVTHHVYDSDGPKDVAKKLAGKTLFGDRPGLWDTVNPTLEEVLKNAGWWGKPLWITETGWESGEVGEAKQADNLTGLLDEWFTGRPDRGWIDKVFVYEMDDADTPEKPTWGLVRLNGAPKPSWYAYRDFIGERPGGPPLDLFGGRFSVEVSWRDHQGNSGYGQPVPDSNLSGFFWFFNQENLELVVKVIDGRQVNGHFWFFYGALSDVEYWITVTDKTTGERRQYHNPSGNLCGDADTKAFKDAGSASVPFLSQPAAPLAASCPSGLCLLDARFRVDVQFRDPNTGLPGTGTPVPRTDQSGTFWFFNPQNVELVVKILDGRPLTGKFWVFYGALSDVEYWITVTDTQTGASKQYHNARGNLCGKGDTSAL